MFDIFNLKVLLFANSILSTWLMPDILWDPRNPMFDEGRCHPSSRKFSARLNHDVLILCANADLNNGFKEGRSVPKRNYHYNIFMTDDKKSYESRNAENAIKLRDCNQKMIKSSSTSTSCVIVKHTEKLRNFAPMGGHTYVIGKTYYFFTTSNGTKSSLNNLHSNRSSMGFEVFVCPTGQPCEQRINVCNLYAPTVELQHGGLGGMISSDQSKLYFSVLLLVAFIVGVLSTIVVLRIKRAVFSTKMPPSREQMRLTNPSSDKRHVTT